MSKVDMSNIIKSINLNILSNNYNKKLLHEIQTLFVSEEEKLFINNYYRYLNYDKLKDFVINFDTLTIELGYKKKENSEKFLCDNFIVDKDYIIDGDSYMLNIYCFKLFCIRSTTKKSNEIYEYYMRLEELVSKMVLEENNELKLNIAIIKEKNNELNLEINKKEKNITSLQLQLDVVKEERIKEERINKYYPNNLKLEVSNFTFGNIIPSIVEKITNNIQTYRMIL